MKSDNEALFPAVIHFSRWLPRWTDSHGIHSWFRSPFQGWLPASASAAEGLAVSVAQRQQIIAEQLRLAYENTSVIVASAVLAKCLVVIVLWGQVPIGRLLGWWGAAIAVHVVGVPAFRYLTRGEWLARAEGLVQMHYALVLAAALVWGSALWVLVPARLEYQWLVLAIICAGALTSIVHYAIHLPTLYMFYGIVLLAVAAAFLHQGRWLSTVIAVGVLGLLATCVSLGRHFNRTLTRAMTTNLSHAALVQDLALQKDLAEQANQAKTRFLAAASHDLRQPMHTVGLLVDILRERMDYPDDRRHRDKSLIDKIHVTVQALETLFQGLLDISKLDAGAVKPVLRDFPLAEVLALIQLHFAPQADAQGLRFKVSASRAVIRSDPVLLERILANLVANALRYTPQGRVLVRCCRRGDQHLIQVWDSGIGIAPEHLDTIFEEFVQLPTAEHGRNQGLGLGLAIVKRSAELLGHAVSVRSRPGQGTCFTVALPRAEPEHPDYQASAKISSQPVATLPLLPVAASPQPDPAFAGRWVVVMEDEETVRQAMETLLQQWGCQVLGVASAMQAIAGLQVHRRPPDLVIADYRLGNGPDGLAAIEALRAQLALPLPALLVTGDVAAVDTGRAAQLRVPIAHKPVSAQCLRHLIGGLLTQSPTAGAQTQPARAEVSGR